MAYTLGEHRLDGISILLVDDEQATTMVFALLLEVYGAEVAVAGTAAEGFRKAEEIQPDVVISDIRLPDGSGVDLLVRLRNSPLEKVRTIPIIAVTGQVPPLRGQTMEGEMHAFGFQAFLAKPVEVDELVTLLIRLSAGQARE